MGKFGVVHFPRLMSSSLCQLLCLAMMFPCTWSCQCVGGHEAVSDRGNYKHTHV